MTSDFEQIPESQSNVSCSIVDAGKSTASGHTFSIEQSDAERYYNANDIDICVDCFGFFENHNDGQLEPVQRYSFVTQNRMTVQVITYNATVTSIQVPDCYGLVADVLLGHDSLPNCIVDPRAFGAITNCGDSCDLNNINWIPHLNRSTLTLTHLYDTKSSAILFVCEFEVTPHNCLIVSLKSRALLPMTLNVGWNLFMNLRGHSVDHIYDQVIVLNAGEHVTEAGAVKIAKDAPENLQTAVDFGTAIARNNYHGFNDHFRITKFGGQQKAFVGRVYDPSTGRSLEIYSTQPMLHLTTTNDWPTNWHRDIDGIRLRHNHLVTAKCTSAGNDATNDNPPPEPVTNALLAGKMGAQYKRHCAFSLCLLKQPSSMRPIQVKSTEHQQTTWYRFGIGAHKADSSGF